MQIAEHYSAADTIHLDMDNLSTHTRKALVDRFGEVAGGSALRRDSRNSAMFMQRFYHLGVEARGEYSSQRVI